MTTVSLASNYLQHIVDPNVVSCIKILLDRQYRLIDIDETLLDSVKDLQDRVKTLESKVSNLSDKTIYGEYVD